MARRYRARIEEESDDSDVPIRYRATKSQTPKRGQFRPRARSESSESEPEETQTRPVPKTPLYRNTQTRLVHVSSLQKFSKSLSKPANGGTTNLSDLPLARANLCVDGSPTVNDRAKVRSSSAVIEKAQNNVSVAKEDVLCQSYHGSSEIEADTGSSDASPPRREDEPRSLEMMTPQPLLDLSHNFQSLRIIADSQGQPDEGSLPSSCPSTSSDKENDHGASRFSPTPSRFRTKAPEDNRPVTPPPASPVKSRLQSPSKKTTRIPTPPGRPSLDTFWNASDINAWNDQHSPKKSLRSPRKALVSRTPDGGSEVPDDRCPTPGDSRRDKAALAQRKLFDLNKHALAITFLAELDVAITDNQITALAASTGGVRVVWSKTLNSTAGRAVWRRETAPARTNPSACSSAASSDNAAAASVALPSSLGSTPSSTDVSSTGIGGKPGSGIRHFAKIELAEKVISDAHRLRNVLAHEFCHLANFMISGIRDQPHGASFRAWGARVDAAFGSRGVHVTTTHSFEIEYKFAWRCAGRGDEGSLAGSGRGGVDTREECESNEPSGDELRQKGCGTEYQRHSRSIDPRTQRCGACRGRLIQVRPVPRNRVSRAAGGEQQGAKVKGYAAFVQKHFATVKTGLPAGASHKMVMEALGAKYRAERAATSDEANLQVGLRPPGSSEDVDKEGAEGRTRGPDGAGSGIDAMTKALEVIELSDDDGT